MPERRPFIHKGVCFPFGENNPNGITTETRPAGRVVFDCTQMRQPTTDCLITGKPCIRLPDFNLAEVKGVLHSETEGGKISLDTASGRLTSPSGIALLTPAEIAIMSTLMRSHGEVVSHRRLYNAVSPEFDFRIPTEERNRNTINVHISRIRSKLGERPGHQRQSGVQIIETIQQSQNRRGGYRLTRVEPHVTVR